MTVWKLVGSICTTNSAVGPEKLRQKAKSTAISLQHSRAGVAVMPRDAAIMRALLPT